MSGTGSLPRPSRPARPSLNPPTSALPALPNPKTRKSLGESRLPYSMDANRSTSLLPSPIVTSPHSSVSSPATPAGKDDDLDPMATADDAQSTSNALKPGNKVVRRTVSIAAFPQPPKTGSRMSSLPTSSPLARPARPSLSTQGNRRKSALRRSSTDKVSPATPDGGNRLKRPKTATASNGSLKSFTGSRTPTLLNGTGDTKSISSGAGARGSDGLLSLPSPPQSRSSSAQGSCSTSATTFDESGDSSPQEQSHDRADDDLRHGSKSKEGKGNVIVSVRVRPDAGGADNPRPEGEWMVDGRRSLVAYRGREGGDYYYDQVFTAHDKNAKVYDASAKRLVRRVMEGYHGTVFAYGMTGTGKTFSMQGTTSSPGVIPLAITDIFSYIRETPHREFLLRVSYLEIYNEKIHDLLSVSAGADMLGGTAQEEIKLREDPKRGVYASPLKEEIVQSPTQLLRVIARGDHARRTSSTQFNARSSRSHAVVQIVVESRERMVPGGPVRDGKRAAIIPGGVRVSTLSLIDLAGSERAAESKERRTEGAHINKSLLTLGTVIARLSGDADKASSSTDKDHKDGKHLPYRDSKLTRLLQGALSGNSLVSILCTIQIGSAGSVATANAHTGETLNTLKFAARAKNNIVSHAKRAEEAMGGGSGDAGSRVLLERYRMEIQDLRNELESQAKAKMEEEEKLLEKEQEVRHEEQMLEMQLARTALKERIEHLNRLILSSQSIGVNTSGSMSSLGMHRTPGQESSARSSLAPSLAGDQSLTRTASMGSTSSAPPNQNHAASPSSQPAGDHGRDDEDSIGENGDGTATLAVQVRALQADLSDKNRYISTLEKRLLQARRSSHSRTSLTFSPSHKAATSNLLTGSGEDDSSGNGVTTLLREKDAEIADLRARLDDKDRMVAALRSSARKRDVADLPTPTESHPPRPHVGRKGSSHHQPASPGAAPTADLPIPPRSSSAKAPRQAATRATAGKNGDEMSRMLDEMIQDHRVLQTRRSQPHFQVTSQAASQTASQAQSQTPSQDASIAATMGTSVTAPDAPVEDAQHDDDHPPPPPPKEKDTEMEKHQPKEGQFPLELELLKFPLPAKGSPLPSPIRAS
ncbi:MAG: oligomeric, coiled-coil, peripheral membrane protein [Chaenotheca gracillima]|nr:MAG: oligomeric, coiled-coil, peripheral membrane protein [Chaenotheca gracillima]